MCLISVLCLWKGVAKFWNNLLWSKNAVTNFGLVTFSALICHSFSKNRYFGASSKTFSFFYLLQLSLTETRESLGKKPHIKIGFSLKIWKFPPISTFCLHKLIDKRKILSEKVSLHHIFTQTNNHVQID